MHSFNDLPKSTEIGLPLLNPFYQKVFLLRYKNRLTYREIAEQTGKTEEYARQLVNRIRTKLVKLDKMLLKFEGTDEELVELLHKWVHIPIEKEI